MKPSRFGPIVKALRVLRGVNTTIAATLAAEIGDIAHFAKPASVDGMVGARSK